MNLPAPLSTLLRGKLTRNVGGTLLTQVLSWTAALAVTLFVPRYLGAAGSGMLTVAAALSGTLGILVNGGTSNVLIREIARRPERAAVLVRQALILRTLTGTGVIVLGSLAVLALGYPPSLRLLVLLSLVTACAGQVGDALPSALRGLEEFKRVNAAVLAEKLLVSALSIGLVFLRAPIWAFVAVYLVGAVLSATLCWRALGAARAAAPASAEGDTAGAAPLWSLARAGLPFLAAMFFMSVYGDGSSALLLSKMAPFAVVGWFGLAKKLSGAAQMLPVAVASVLLPALSRLHASGERERFARTVRRMTALMAVAALPLSALLIAAPGWILHVIRYPASFEGSIPVLRVAGAVLVLWFLQQAVGTALIASDRQAVFGRVTGVAALLSLPVCGACIYAAQHYYGNGAGGAIVGDAVLEIYMLVSYIRALPPETWRWRRADLSLAGLSVREVAT